MSVKAIKVNCIIKYVDMNFTERWKELEEKSCMKKKLVVKYRKDPIKIILKSIKEK